MTPNCPKCEGPMNLVTVIREKKMKFKLYQCSKDGELKGVPLWHSKS